MSERGTTRQRIVLRRLKDSLQAIELAPTATPRASEWPQDWPCSVAAYQDGEFQCYVVDLPRGLAVRPVDWRRFAYDHEKVRELLGFCVQDNVRERATFDARTSDLKEELESSVWCALHDLTSVFDVTSVRCDFEGDSILLTVEGEHKNGDHVSYCFRFDSRG